MSLRQRVEDLEQEVKCLKEKVIYVRFIGSSILASYDIPVKEAIELIVRYLDLEYKPEDCTAAKVIKRVRKK